MILVISSIELLRALIVDKSPDLIVLDTKKGTFPRMLQDSFGETLVILKKPQRIISQTLATDEILLALCPPERIIALSALATNDYYSHVVKQAKWTVKQQIDGGIESILGLNPDLVFVATYNRIEMVNLLRATGSQVFRFNNFHSVNDIKNNIRIMGYMIGEDERANSLITQMEQAITTIRQKIPKNMPPPRILFYDSWNYTAGRHTFFDDMVHLVHGINLASEKDIEGYVKLNSEFIHDWQPDVIVTSAVQGQFEQTRRHLLENPMIATSLAGKAGHIIVIDHRDFNATSHYIVPAIATLAEGLYGHF